MGDRAFHLQFGIERLGTLLFGLRISRFRETEPWGGDRQPLYLNAAAIGATMLDPFELLDAMRTIECDRGRHRPFPNAPRILDLDLILYGVEIIETDRLQVPHPRLRQRACVLEPLADLAPHAIDPVSGKSMSQLRAELTAN